MVQSERRHLNAQRPPSPTPTSYTMTPTEIGAIVILEADGGLYELPTARGALSLPST